jgi:hypothetical protein
VIQSDQSSNKFALFAAFAFVTASWNITPLQAEPINFDKQIAPILVSHCLECHRGAKPEGGLNLTESALVKTGGDSGEVIVSGKAADSLLWERVSSDEMPPKHPLNMADKAALKQWIDEGANWGRGPLDMFSITTNLRAGRDWWSLKALRKVTPPELKSNWGRNGIDAFVQRRLQDEGLQPSPEADPRTLIRRLYFDLVGLPPEPEEVAAFVTEPTAESYEALVDKLLASPHYGERWGRHWLDIARYGETQGFERNEPRHNSWPYRDWVIDALNADMPYDRFAQMQLAGDILDQGPEGAAAVGFLVAGVHNTVVGGSERMKLLARQDELEEIAGAVGQTFLGLTVNCARCHDHKFDPVTAQEYYQFIAALDGVQHGERDVVGINVATDLAKAQATLAELELLLAKIDDGTRAAILAKRQQHPDAQRAAEVPEPYAAWEFEGDLRDARGRLHGEAHGSARIEQGTLVVDGRDAYVTTSPLPLPVAEKTLEAWVQLADLKQRGGAAISLEAFDGGQFDAIVFGEREERHWMAGSNSFTRTQPFGGPEESTAAEKPTHITFVYSRDGTITGYRNGVPYGQPYQTGLANYAAQKSHIVFGLRHSPVGGNKMLAGKILRARFYDRALSAEEVAASAGAETNYVSEKSIVAALSDAQRAERAKLKSQLEEARSQAAKVSASRMQRIFTVNPRNPGVMRVHARGDVTEFGVNVAPAGVASVAGEHADFGLSQDAPDAQRRQQLAKWITHPNNPLFARVIVNRVWHHHFGTGLVETPSDLGFNGGQPSHPDLLDWLVGKFQRSGYRLKMLHKLIVMSSTYRQASTLNDAAFAKDAGNRWLWRYSRRRIEAEVVRDSMLQIAGELNPQRGGPGYVDVSITPNSGTTYYEPIDRDGAEFLRRTIYRFTPRGGRSAVLDTFDCPDPSTAAPRRSITTTPLQALSLLNNRFVLKMSDALAQRAMREVEGGGETATIRRVWQLVLCREPSDDEARLSEALVKKHGLGALSRALFNTNEFVVIE